MLDCAFSGEKCMNISNHELIELIKAKAKSEKRLTIEVIKLIHEIEKRRLHLDLGFGSVFEFVTKELGYDEGAALRRISAARLLHQIPEIESKVSVGKLSLSNIASAQVFFRREEKLRNEKLSLV